VKRLGTRGSGLETGGSRASNTEGDSHSDSPGPSPQPPSRLSAVRMSVSRRW
jgi:hypothetical protein